MLSHAFVESTPQLKHLLMMIDFHAQSDHNPYLNLTYCSDRVDVTLVSPRNYFLYTPLLPAAATGTVEERSIVEPVRKMLGNKVCHIHI